jgi:RNA polymerase sigma factor (sigma-70 family)
VTRTTTGIHHVGSSEVILYPVKSISAIEADDLVPLIPTLLAAARYMVRSEAEARDLTQATLEIGIRQLHQLRDPAKLRPWLLTILTRESRRLRRRLKHLVAIEPTVRDLHDGDSADGISLVIRQAIAALAPKMRAAIVLHHMVGLSVSETATAMGVSENTIKSELKAGLRRLREDLDDQVF